MGNFGETAVRAVELYVREGHLSPRTAWDQAAAELLRTTSMREKGCPRATFLSLCQEGLVPGIPPGSYTTAHENRDHAIEAVRRLSADETLGAEGPRRLWKLIAGEKCHNEQMDVVLALWKHGLVQLDVVAEPGRAAGTKGKGQ